IPPTATASSTPFSPPSPAAWGWGWPSASRSSLPTAAGSGPARTPTAGPRFSSRCPAYPSPRPRGGGRGEGKGGCPVTGPAPTVFVIDDDPSVRKALGRLLRAAGFRVEAFADADEFLGRPLPDGPACLVLDVCLPGIDGLDLQRTLSGRQAELPV